MNDRSEVNYEMGYGAQEFGKVLCGPFSGEKSDYVSESIASNHWKVRQKNSSFCVEIEVSEQPDRELGLLRLPVLKVRFEIQDDPGDSTAAFFKRFHQYFHKGGG
jgi:hypothetical protein